MEGKNLNFLGKLLFLKFLILQATVLLCRWPNQRHPKVMLDNEHRLLGDPEAGEGMRYTSGRVYISK